MIPKTQVTLEQYKEDVINLIKSAKDINLKSRGQIFSECFYLLNSSEEINSSRKIKTRRRNSILKKLLIFILISFVLAISIYILLNFHQPTSSLVLRNVQGFIYPGLKFLRILSVPVIRNFPILTGLYDESCLIENPYFYVHEMECWPCFGVFSVFELVGSQNQTIYMSGKPHITKTNHKPVSFNQLRNQYNQNKCSFNKESCSVKSSSNDIKNLGELFSQNSKEIRFSNIHVSWRINKMSLARIIRSLFPRPESLPDRSGQSVERFIMIDGAKASAYVLPSMECSYISIRQAMGQRTIVLKPSPECSQGCRTISVILNSSTILWYNWWYWRPVSLPVVNATDLSITYISSYC